MAMIVATTVVAQVNLPTKTINGRVVYYYEVPPKETIYSITRKFNVTREELMRLNPKLIDGLRAGSTIIIGEVTNPAYTEPDEKEPAEEPQEETEETETADEEQTDVDAVEVEETYPDETASKPAAEPLVADTLEAAADNPDFINVAVVLPYMLDSENMTRNAQNQLNFYRGMLLALDQRPADDIKIRVVAVDSEGTPEKVEEFISSPEFGNMDYIVAPSDSLSIEILATAADTTGATVLNMFAVKNDAHLRHESVLQANIPHAEMYNSAIAGFIKNFQNKKVLFLNATDIPADKQSFVSQLSDMLIKGGIPWETIDYSGKLTSEQISGLPKNDYIFVPTSSSREALLKVIPALIEFHNATPESEARLFGYPEWVVLRGDIKENLHRLNATVYSRFSTDLDGSDVEAVNTAYTKWFGSEPAPSFPDTMLLGFDTMAWIVSTAANGLDAPYRGFQNAFTISEVQNGGDVNTALYFITFGVDGHVTAETL